MQRIKYAFVLAVFLANIAITKASLLETTLSETDTISVSLLTATPGKQIYERFGHTGIRIHVPSKKFDGVYHYGLFSFSDPNFEYRFMKGKTDYMIGCMHYHDFLTMYALRGSGVRELKLNLTQEEARNLFDALLVNILPENQTYRYSFLYDNCATRPLEIILRNLRGEVTIASLEEPIPTFRNLIHECTAQDKWVMFGLDLILDGEVDDKISLPNKPFLPHITEQIFQTASIVRGGVEESLSSVPVEVLAARVEEKDSSIFDYITPNVLSITLLLLVIVASGVEIRRVKHNKTLDTIIFAICGILGVVIFFLMLFSEHPAVSSNLNAIWLHPIWLVVIPLIWIRKAQKFLYCYHFINFALLLLYFIIAIFATQYIEFATFMFVGILLVRSITYILLDRKLRKNRAKTR